jgi:hypothetical protein
LDATQFPNLLQIKIASAEQSQQSYYDQVDCNDIVQKPGYDQNDDSGDERNERGDAESHIHGGLRANVVTMSELCRGVDLRCAARALKAIAGQLSR